MPPEKVLELGIVGASGSGRVIRIELASANAEEIVARLFGGELTRCRTCSALGKTVSVPRSALERHDLTEHRDLWLRGRRLAELAAIAEQTRGRTPPE